MPKPQHLFEKYLVRESLVWALVKKEVFGVVAYLGALFCMFVVLCANDSMRHPGRSDDIGGPLGAMALVFAGMAGMALCSSLGGRLISRSGITLLRWSKKAPILYLRSFGTDTKWIDNWTDIFWIVFFGPRFETYEWSLAKAIRGYGPLVAIGKPGEVLPPLGAARIYVEGSHWQEVVADLVAHSQIIILRAGRTSGFWWEIKHLVGNCDPQRILIYLPKKDRGNTYAYLRDQAASELPFVLPEYCGSAMFLGFGPKWEPVLYGWQGPSFVSMFRRLLIGSPAPAIREAINPALAAAGIPPHPLPLQFREWLLVLIFVAFFFGFWAFLLVMTSMMNN